MNPYSFLKRSSPQPPAKGRRMYAGAEYSRLTSGWAPTSSSQDAETMTSLRVLRNRSRQLIRDNEYALNGVRQIKQNVIGTGIGLQAAAQSARGSLLKRVNDSIEDTFREWWMDPKAVHTAGLMDGPAIERYLVHQLVESGEAFVRLVQKPFGDSDIPLALEVFEADRLIDNYSQTTAPNGNIIRMGIEIDQWYRPQAYWCWPHHPGDFQFTSFEPSKFLRFDAEDILHVYVIDRWPQTRGTPWFHAAMKRLNNMGGYEEAEIVRARASAAIMGFVTSEAGAMEPDAVVDGQRVTDMQPGQIQQLLPGEEFTGFNPSSPNAALDPFMRLMVRGVAAGLGMSYESLSRDYTNTNYSSARAAQLEDRDLWRVIQHFFISAVRRPVHQRFLDAAVLAGKLSMPDYASNVKKYRRARFKPRGWAWIDPTREVNAYLTAVRAGFMTNGDVIAQSNGGKDAEDVFKERREELDSMAELHLVLDTDPAQVNNKGIAQPNTAPEEKVDAPAETGEEASNPDAPDEDDEPSPAATKQPTQQQQQQPAKGTANKKAAKTARK